MQYFTGTNEQSDRIIQTFADLLRTSVMDSRGSWSEACMADHVGHRVVGDGISDLGADPVLLI